MTLCPNEREVQFIFCVHLFGRIKRHSVFSSFNCSLFSIIALHTSVVHASGSGQLQANSHVAGP